MYLGVEGRHQTRGVVVHQLDEHGEHVPQVPVLVHRGQVVEDALQLVLLHPRPDHHQLLHEVEDVGPDGDNLLLAGPRDVHPLGGHPGVEAGAGPHHPVVGLEGVHGLQHRGHAPHVAVDLRVGQELRGEVAVEPSLHAGRGVDPQRGVEQAVVQQLLEQQVAVVGGAGDQVLGQLEEGVEQVGGEVIPAGLGEQVRDDKEAAAGDDLLLDAGAALHQLADELHQAGAEARVPAAAAPRHRRGAAVGDGHHSCGGCCAAGVRVVVHGHRVVELGEEGEEHLDAPDGVEGGVDGSGDHGGHVLRIAEDEKWFGTF